MICLQEVLSTHGNDEKYWLANIICFSGRHNKIMIGLDERILWKYRIIGPDLNSYVSGCQCNDYLHLGRGDCQSQSASGCGLWCYVNDGSSCYDARTSVYGAPYQWSCEACRMRQESGNSSGEC